MAKKNLLIDRKYLKRTGYSDADIRQIEKALKKTTFDLNGRRISARKAFDLLGAERFSAGMGRSAFHWSAANYTDSGASVGFNSRKFFMED